MQHTVRLPYGTRATFSYSEAGFNVEWEPAPPVIRNPRARRRFFEAYREARAAFLQDVAAVMGGNVLVVDTSGEMAVIRQPVKH